MAGRLSKIFSKDNMKRPIFWGSSLGILFILVIIGATVYNIVDQPRFCVSCHIEQGPYDTWEKSTHSRVVCTKCHVEPGFANSIKFRTTLIRLIYITFSKDPSKPTQVTLPGNDNCNECHKAKRRISASGDLLIPHDSHIKLRGLRCVDCHRNLVHNIKASKHNRPPMITCYKCHDGKKAPNQCTACHTEKSVPEDHRAADWLKTHRAKQLEDPAYCERCHGWVKGYCVECHQRRPKSHAGKWRTNHQVKISSDGKQGCAFCHRDDMCIRCHGITPGT